MVPQALLPLEGLPPALWVPAFVAVSSLLETSPAPVLPAVLESYPAREWLWHLSPQHIRQAVFGSESPVDHDTCVYPPQPNLKSNKIPGENAVFPLVSDPMRPQNRSYQYAYHLRASELWQVALEPVFFAPYPIR